MVRFKAILFKYPGKGGWTFAPVPPELAPPVGGPFGMTPVLARLDGREWRTTVWRERSGAVLLPAPAKVRGAKKAGDEVEVEIEADWSR